LGGKPDFIAEKQEPAFATINNARKTLVYQFKKKLPDI
jgi:hypothetical protein